MSKQLALFRWLILIVGLLALAAAVPAVADDFMDCNQTVDRDLQIRVCTSLIESGTLNASNLAGALNDRGRAYVAKGELDLAIADYNRAIEISPYTAEAYYNRGTAYRKMGDAKRGAADYDEAMQIELSNQSNQL